MFPICPPPLLDAWIGNANNFYSQTKAEKRARTLVTAESARMFLTSDLFAAVEVDFREVHEAFERAEVA